MAARAHQKHAKNEEKPAGKEKQPAAKAAALLPVRLRIDEGPKAISY